MTNGEGAEPGDDGGEQPAVLLDRVMRGERSLVFPPGTFVASLVIPCFAVGAASVTMAAGMSLARSRTAILAAIGAASVLTGIVIVGHALVIRGRFSHRTGMRTYTRTVIGVTLATAAILLAGDVLTIPWPLLAVGLTAFVLCDLLLGSHGYIAFSSFFSLKRKYRDDMASARAHVLSVPPRSGEVRR